jgi:hypothetical protein
MRLTRRTGQAPRSGHLRTTRPARAQPRSVREILPVARDGGAATGRLLATSRHFVGVVGRDVVVLRRGDGSERRRFALAEASPAALWAVIEHFAVLPLFGGGKPRLNVSFHICVRCSDHEPQLRGSPRHVANVVLLVPATLQIGEDATLRGGLPAPNKGRRTHLTITAQRAAGLASAGVRRSVTINRPVVEEIGSGCPKRQSDRPSGAVGPG